MNDARVTPRDGDEYDKDFDFSLKLILFKYLPWRCALGKKSLPLPYQSTVKLASYKVRTGKIYLP